MCKLLNFEKWALEKKLIIVRITCNITEIYNENESPRHSYYLALEPGKLSGVN